jgi:ectoine hydroxylase-related dioxygenase (phytanoyl-CoA dioxygenase family)
LEELTEFVQTTHTDSGSGAARNHLIRDGYLFIRDFLPEGEVADVESCIREAVAATPGWIAEDSDLSGWKAGPSAADNLDGEPDFIAMYRRIQSIQKFHEFAHHPRILSIVGRLLQDEVFAHSNHVARVVGPSPKITSTKNHQDWRPIQGAADTLTVWIPLANIPVVSGGLRILEGSHRLGVLPIEDASHPAGPLIPVDDNDKQWRTASYRRGDVLIFHSFTVHGGLPNKTDELRRSCEFRYQRVSDPAVESTVQRPHWYPAIPDWPELTVGWTSTSSIETPDFVRVDILDDTQRDLATPSSQLLD